MADVELLPLPWTLCHFHDDTQEAIRAYARANVLHHTATLQTEIEALRAEVSELRAARIAYASEFPEAKDGGPDTGNIHTNIRSLKARAERLAEALRSSADALERLAFAIRAPNVHTPQLVELAIAMRAAALAQEDRNG